MLRQVEPAAHRDLEIAPFQVERVLVPRDAAETEIDPAARVRPDHLLRGKGAGGPPRPERLDPYPRVPQRGDDRRPVLVALPDEGDVERLFHLVRPMDLRVGSLRQVEGDRPLDAIFLEGVAGAGPAQVEIPADVAYPRCRPVPDPSDERLLVVEGEVDHRRPEVRQFTRGLRRHELPGQVRENEAKRSFPRPRTGEFEEIPVHLPLELFPPILAPVVETVAPVVAHRFPELLQCRHERSALPVVVVEDGQRAQGSAGELTARRGRLAFAARAMASGSGTASPRRSNSRW